MIIKKFTKEELNRLENLIEEVKEVIYSQNPNENNPSILVNKKTLEVVEIELKENQFIPDYIFVEGYHYENEIVYEIDEKELRDCLSILFN